MGAGNVYPAAKSTMPDTFLVEGVWTGGGAAANCTKAAADRSHGILSVNYNAATGKYIIAFLDVGNQIVGGSVEIMRAAGAAPLKANIVRASFSASAKTVQFEVWDLATPSLTALATTDLVCVSIKFAKNGVNS